MIKPQKIFKPYKQECQISICNQKSTKKRKPVISSVNCHTTKISQYVDNHLQPHVQELETYVKDSTDFIKYPRLTKYHKVFSDHGISLTLHQHSQ